MTKHKRNYNQDHFKVGGSPQPGEQEMPEESKAKLTQQDKRDGDEAENRKVPPGAPGTTPEPEPGP